MVDENANEVGPERGEGQVLDMWNDTHSILANSLSRGNAVACAIQRGQLLRTAPPRPTRR